MSESSIDTHREGPGRGQRAPRRRPRPWLAGFVVLIVALVVAGFGYQTISERRDLRDHPAPGRMIAVGEHRLHLHCMGSGQPTVLLEAGLGNDVNHWSRVQPGIADVTRVCAYDRAGLGWSDAGQRPRTAARVVQELTRLLESSGERPPYVIAGHSNGGPYALLFADAHPERVSGLVLVDPNPGAYSGCAELPAGTRLLYGTLAGLAPLGLPRLVLPHLFPLHGSPLPAEQREVHEVLRARTGAIQAVWSEWKATCAMVEAAGAATPPTGIPIVVLSAEKRPANATRVSELHRQMAQDLGTADVVVAHGSGHWIHLDRPDIVRDAILGVVERAGETGTSPSTP